MSKTATKSSISPQTAIVLLVSVVIVAVTYYLAMPQAEKLKVKGEQLAAKKSQIKALEARKESLVRLAGLINQYQADIARLGSAYPSEDQTVEAMIQAQSLVERSGLTVVSLTPNKVKDGGVPVSMSLKGSYQGLGQLLRELQFNLRPVVLSEMTVNSASKEQNVISVTIVANFQFNDKGAATGSTKAESGNASAQGSSPAAVASPATKSAAEEAS